MRSRFTNCICLFKYEGEEKKHSKGAKRSFVCTVARYTSVLCIEKVVYENFQSGALGKVGHENMHGKYSWNSVNNIVEPPTQRHQDFMKNDEQRRRNALL